MKTFFHFRPLVATLGLSLLAVLGTWFSLPLFFGVDFLFGSVFVLIALRRLGMVSALVAAFAMGVTTLFLWHHPYATVLFVTQVLFVGIALRRKPEGNLPVLVLLYWLFVGLFLAPLIYRFLLDSSWMTAGMVTFKQATNEVFNALLATLLLHALQLRFPARDTSTVKLNVHSLQTNLLASFAFLPALVVITLSARQLVQNAEQDIQRLLTDQASKITSRVRLLQQTYYQQLRALADKGGHLTREELLLVASANPELIFIHAADLQGGIYLSTKENQEEITGINYHDRDWFQRLVATQTPVYSGAIIGRTSKLPAIAMAVPIRNGDQLSGLILSSVSSQGLMQRIVGDKTHESLRISLLDAKGAVIGSTESAFKPLQIFIKMRGGELKEVHGQIQRWQPGQGKTAMQTWAKSYFVHHSVNNMEGWQLVVEAPLAPYAEDLQRSYLITFAATFVFAILAFLLGSRLGRVVSEPLSRLSEAASRLSRDPGGRTVLDLPSSRVYEISTLNQDFARMAKSLHESYAELARSRDQLEERVIERNLELAQRQNALDEHAIVSITDVAGNIQYANDKFINISGYAREEVLGQNHRILKSGEHPPEFYETMWRTISQGKPWHGQVCNRAKDGSLYWVASTIVPMLDGQGLPHRYISIRTDITSQKNIERELMQAKEEAERANRAKSDFLSSMSHELRTPMNGILGFAQLLDYDKALNETQRDAVQEILRAGEHLLDLINEVLDLARIESGNLSISLGTVDCAAIVHEVSSLIAPMASRGNIQLNKPAAIKVGLSVQADRTRLRQILLNLLSNAVKYNHEGGTVDFTVEQAGERVIFHVRDNGKGIPLERQAEMFQPFQRLGAEFSAVEGTGIGLTISKALVEHMGGKIGFISTPGQGSDFWVSLPGQQGGEMLPEPATTIEIKTEDLTGTVLYVEDNPANVRLMEKLIAKYPGLRLVTAHEPRLGLDLARTHKPDVILLDINLPYMSGYEVLHLLRADAGLAQLPIIAVSANAMESDMQKGMEAGFDGYVTKPINVGAFIEILRRALSGQTSH